MSNPAFHPNTAVRGAKNGSGAPVEVEKAWPCSGRYRQMANEWREATKHKKQLDKRTNTVSPVFQSFFLLLLWQGS